MLIWQRIRKQEKQGDEEAGGQQASRMRGEDRGGTAVWRERESGVERKAEGSIVIYCLHLSGIKLCWARNNIHWDMRKPVSNTSVWLCLLRKGFESLPGNTLLCSLRRKRLRSSFIQLAIRKSIYCGLCCLCFPPFPFFFLVFSSSLDSFPSLWPDLQSENKKEKTGA